MSSSCGNFYCENSDHGTCPRCYRITGQGCNHGPMCPVCLVEAPNTCVTCMKKGGLLYVGTGERPMHFGPCQTHGIGMPKDLKGVTVLARPNIARLRLVRTGDPDIDEVLELLAPEYPLSLL